MDAEQGEMSEVLPISGREGISLSEVLVPASDPRLALRMRHVTPGRGLQVGLSRRLTTPCVTEGGPPNAPVNRPQHSSGRNRDVDRLRSSGSCGAILLQYW